MNVAKCSLYQDEICFYLLSTRYCLFIFALTSWDFDHWQHLFPESKIFFFLSDLATVSQVLDLLDDDDDMEDVIGIITEPPMVRQESDED